MEPLNSDRKELALKLFAAWSTGDSDVITPLLSENVRLHDTCVNEVFEGRAAVKAFIEGGMEGFSDVSFAPNDLWTTDDPDKVAVRWDMQGTNTATGKSYSVPGMSVIAFDGDMVSAETDYYSGELIAATFNTEEPSAT